MAALLFGYLEKNETGLRTLFVGSSRPGLLQTGRLPRRLMLGSPIPHLSPDTGRFRRYCSLALLALRWLRPPDYRIAVRGLLVLLLIAGCSMVWMVPELVYLGLRAQRTDVLVPVTHPALVSDGSNPAVARRTDRVAPFRRAFL